MKNLSLQAMSITAAALTFSAACASTNKKNLDEKTDQPSIGAVNPVVGQNDLQRRKTMLCDPIMGPPIICSQRGQYWPFGIGL